MSQYNQVRSYFSFQWHITDECDQRCKSVFGGIAIGKISVFSKKEHKIVRVKINDTNVELARFEEARQPERKVLNVH